MWQNAVNLLICCSPYLTAMLASRVPGGGRRRARPRVNGNQLTAANPARTMFQDDSPPDLG
jgi:hypothetical protein